MEPGEDSHREMNREYKRKNSLLVVHPDLHIKKSKIFESHDPNLRKTKIICTIGY